MLIALDWLVVGDVGIEIPGESQPRVLGGAAARLAAHAAAFGLTVALAGKVGDDDAAGQAREQLRRANVELRWLRAAPGVPTTIWHEVPDHPLARRVERGADLAIRLDEIPTPSAVRARLTVVSGFSLLVEPSRSAALGSLELAARRGGRSALQLEADRLWSTNARTTRRVLEPAIAAAHTVALNAADAKVMFGGRMSPKEAVREIVRMGPRIVLLEDGGSGYLLQEGARLHTIPGQRPGATAGDRFAGPAAFWVGLTRRMPVKKAALAALRYAASIRRPGAPRQPVRLSG